MDRLVCFNSYLLSLFSYLHDMQMLIERKTYASYKSLVMGEGRKIYMGCVWHQRSCKYSWFS